MANVMDFHISQETPFLEELVGDLESTLHMIAHAGYSENRDFILDRQKYLREKYGKYLSHCISDQAMFHIIPAYEIIQELLEQNPSPARIREECEECLYEHIELGEPSDELLSPFSDFFKEDYLN